MLSDFDDLGVSGSDSVRMSLRHLMFELALLCASNSLRRSNVEATDASSASSTSSSRHILSCCNAKYSNITVQYSISEDTIVVRIRNELDIITYIWISHDFNFVLVPEISSSFNTQKL